MLRRAAAMKESGVVVIALLALSDEGKPSYDADNAAALAELGIPAFACTPDLFPDLMAAAIQKRDIGTWAAGRGIVAVALTEKLGWKSHVASHRAPWIHRDSRNETRDTFSGRSEARPCADRHLSAVTVRCLMYS